MELLDILMRLVSDYGALSKYGAFEAYGLFGGLFSGKSVSELTREE